MLNFDVSLPKVLAYEGGFTKDSHDPGNWTGGKVGVGKLKGTNRGISAAAYPNLDIANLTAADVAPLYRHDYWDAVAANLLPAGVDHATFDGAVNSGVSRSSKWLQKAVKVSTDGKVGGKTIAAAVSFQAGAAALVRAVCSQRTSFLHGLSNWVRYGKGWAARVADVEAFGVKLALAAAGASPAAIKVDAEQQSAVAKTSATRHTAGAGVTATAGVADGSQVDVSNVDAGQADQLVNLILGGVLIGAVVLVAWFVWRAHVQRQRAAAYAASAKGT
ncbi:MAG: glycosyl hydrolase 108 family protein [Bauldia sp.]